MTNILPLSPRLINYLSISENKELPIWLKSIIKQSHYDCVSDLFRPDLELIEIDKETEEAILHFCKFVFNESNLKKNPKNIDIGYFSSNLDEVFDASILNVLKRNKINSFEDLSSLSISKILKLENLGFKKFISLFKQLDGYMPIEKNKETFPKKELEVEEEENIKKELEKDFLATLKNKDILNEIFLNDKRFIELSNFLLVHVREKDFNSINISGYDMLSIAKTDLNLNEYRTLIILFELQIKKITSLSLEGQLTDFLNAYLKNEKHFTALKERLGFSESLKKVFTLEESGNLVDLTRERIRQIEAKFIRHSVKRIPENSKIFMPNLNSLKKLILTEISKNKLLHKSDIEKIISSNGFGKWSFERINNSMIFFNHESSLKVNDEGYIYVDESNNSSFDMINKLSKKISSYNGLVNIYLIEEALKKEGKNVSKRDISKIVDLVCLKIDNEWFYRETNFNHIFSMTKKMLNFSEEIPIWDIRNGLIKYKTQREPSFFADKKRSGFYGFSIPTQEIIAKIFDLNDAFELVGNKIKAREHKFDLKGVDLLFYNFFKKRNFEPVTDLELKNYCLKEAKMNESSYFAYITYKPYIKRFARQVWGIVGKDPSRESIINTKNRIHKSNPTVSEWNDRGGISFKLQLKNKATFVFVIPKEFTDFFHKDEYSLMHEGELIKKVKRSNSFIYGLSSYLNNYLNCEIDDFIEIEFDLINSSFHIKLIDEGIYIK